MHLQPSSKRQVREWSVRTLAFAFVLGAFSLVTAAVADSGDPADRTLMEMEAMGAAMLAWVTDQASAGGLRESGPSFDLGSYPTISHGDLAALLVPTYAASVPATDGWGNPYDYRLDTLDVLSLESVAIRSLGADGLAEGNLYSPGYTAGEDDDLVFARNLFVRRPQPSPEEAQGETVRLVRVMGTAMLSWLTDVAGLQGTPPPLRRGPSFDLGLYTPISHGDLSVLLVPGYLPFVPELDGWGNPFDLFVDVLDPLGPATLAIRSAGSDGAVSGDLYSPGGFPFQSDDEDIVWSDGVFIRFPEGGRILSDGFETGDLCAWSSSAPP